MIPQNLTGNLYETACTNPQQGQIPQNPKYPQPRILTILTFLTIPLLEERRWIWFWTKLRVDGHGLPAAIDQLGGYGHLLPVHSRWDGLYQPSARSDSSESQVSPTKDSDHSDLSELSERSLGWAESLDMLCWRAARCQPVSMCCLPQGLTPR